MPLRSLAQNRFVRAKAAEGAPWAEKFLADSQHGPGSLKGLPEHVKQRNREIGKRLMRKH